MTKSNDYRKVDELRAVILAEIIRRDYLEEILASAKSQGSQQTSA